MRIHVAALSLVLLACGNSTPQPAPPDASAAAPVATAPATTATATAAAPTATATAAPEASAAPTASASAEAPPAPVVADNKVDPTEGPELQARAKQLFEAIVSDDPEKGESFWFPREPFLPLKDIKKPEKYWTQLHKTYAKDIHKLHKKRKSWDGAEFVRFDGWSKPKWVKPGDEANKIGYHRAFKGKLRYRIGDDEHAIEVRTIITWQGRWYITHLRKFKK